MANQKSVSDLMGMIAGFAEGASDVLPAAAPAGGAAASASAAAAVGAARMDAVSARLRSTVRSREPRLSCTHSLSRGHDIASVCLCRLRDQDNRNTDSMLTAVVEPLRLSDAARRKPKKVYKVESSGKGGKRERAGRSWSRLAKAANEAARARGS